MNGLYFLRQVKTQIPTLSKCFSDCWGEKVVIWCVSICLCAEVFPSLGTARFVHRFDFTFEIALDLRTGWDLNDPAQRTKMWSHWQHSKFWLLEAGVDLVSGGHTGGGWWTHTFGKFFKVVSLCINTLAIWRWMFMWWNRLWCFASTGGRHSSRIVTRDTTIFPSWIAGPTSLLRWCVEWGKRWLELAVCRSLNLDWQWKNPVLQRWPITITCTLQCDKCIASL